MSGHPTGTVRLGGPTEVPDPGKVSVPSSPPWDTQRAHPGLGTTGTTQAPSSVLSYETAKSVKSPETETGMCKVGVWSFRLHSTPNVGLPLVSGHQTVLRLEVGPTRRPPWVLGEPSSVGTSMEPTVVSVRRVLRQGFLLDTGPRRGLVDTQNVV